MFSCSVDERYRDVAGLMAPVEAPVPLEKEKKMKNRGKKSESELLRTSAVIPLRGTPSTQSREIP